MVKKHTPGPWVVKHSLSHPQWNVVGLQLGHKYKIARCPYPHDLEKDEARVNAVLIAAAPDLLQALEEVLAKIGGPNMDPIWFEEEYERIKAVIRKAKGGE